MFDVMTIVDRKIAWYENPAWTYWPVANDAVQDIELADFDGAGDPDPIVNQG